MSTLPYGSVSSCRHCQLYRAEGRRGGYCQQLNVPVQGNWKSCSLVIPPFAALWTGSEMGLRSAAMTTAVKLVESESHRESESILEAAETAGAIDVAQIDLELMSVAHLLAR